MGLLGHPSFRAATPAFAVLLCGGCGLIVGLGSEPVTSTPADAARDAGAAARDAASPTDVAAPTDTASAADRRSDVASVADAAALDLTSVEDARAADSSLAGADASGPDATSCGLDATTPSSPFDFQPTMVKWPGALLFAAAPLIQSSLAQPACARGDALVVASGARLGGAFHPHLDGAQGSLVVWLTPEWHIDDLPDASRYILRSGDLGFGIDGVGKGLFVELGASRRLLFPGAVDGWRAGETRLVVLRWDSRLALGAGHVVVTVDGAHQAAQETPFAPPIPGAEIVIGAAGADGRGAFGGVVEGLTIYRRPLFDGERGVDLGAGDELAAISSDGAGRDPARVTGSWDVVLALPTDGVPGRFGAGAIEAWSHPHADNLLGVGGFLHEGIGLTWTALGGASLERLPEEEALLGPGMQISTTAAGQGARSGFDVAPGQSFVLRALVHGDGGVVPRLELRDASDQALLASLEGRPGASRSAPDALLVTVEAPASSSSLHVDVVAATDGAGTIFLHQVEVLPNLVANPSVERGGGDPYTPDGWVNENLRSDEIWREEARVHSGAASCGIATRASELPPFAQILQTPRGFDLEGHFYGAGGFFQWLRDEPPYLNVTNGRFVQAHAPEQKFYAVGQAASGSWQHVRGVGRRNDAVDNSHNDILRWGGAQHMRAIGVLVDDAYVVHLEQVPLSARPADLAASAEGTMVRVDGLDLATHPLAGLGAASGALSLWVQLAHPPEDRDRYCPYSSVVFALWGDQDNHVTVFHNDSDLRVHGRFDGHDDVSWTVTNDNFADREAHLVRFSYQVGAQAVLTVDGVAGFSVLLDHAFATVPDTLYAGSHPVLVDRCHVHVSLSGAQVEP